MFSPIQNLFLLVLISLKLFAGSMRFLSTFYISAIAGQLGSGRTTNSQEHDETVAVQLGKEFPWKLKPESS